jgi:hypothetical protein
MKHPPHSTLHAVFEARSRGAGGPVRSNPIAAFLEALYELQRHQAMKVIRLYLRFLGEPGESKAHVNTTQEDRGEAG